MNKNTQASKKDTSLGAFLKCILLEFSLNFDNRINKNKLQFKEIVQTIVLFELKIGFLVNIYKQE